RPVSQTVLNRARIVALLSEIAGAAEATRLAAGEPVRFFYRLPDGKGFVCEAGLRDADAFARVHPHDGPPPPPLPAPSKAAPPPAETLEQASAPVETPPAPLRVEPTPAQEYTPPAPAAAPAPVARVVGPAGSVDALLARMCDMKASDLHL